MNANRTILAVNRGSSSLKFALYDLAVDGALLLVGSGGIDRMGQPGATLLFAARPTGDKVTVAVGSASKRSAAIVECLLETIGGAALAVVAHRVVHGGPRYQQPALVTAELLAELRRISPFDPEHLPLELELIDEFAQRLPALPQVACFDTQFHRDLPLVARLLPLPRKFQRQGVWRYGFHGLSYAYLLEELRRRTDDSTADGRVILAHLGSGASLAAVLGGRSIDTTMAFTPTAGVPMSTRSGDLDPGLVSFLARTENVTVEQFHQMVNHQSGLLGMSETSGDVRDLLACEATDTRAEEALAVFCYQTKKVIGAYAAALAGLDALVFAGGIGERASQIRARICTGLEFFGIELDQARNAANADVISSDASRVCVHVIRTDEEIVLARAARALLTETSTGR